MLSALERSGLPPHRLSLELTESALLEAAPATISQLRGLRAAGIGLGIDDFGTGYASLTYLRNLPVSFIKVDRSFAASLPHDAHALAIVRAVTTLATDLGLGCVVEGIERTEQLEVLRGRGLLAQGYLLGRPAPAAELEPLLAAAARRADGRRGDGTALGSLAG